MTASISRFACLTSPEVVELVHADWPGWLSHMAIDPARPFAGQFGHGGWSPAIYDPPVRRKDNVRAITALVLDFDDAPEWDRLERGWPHLGLLYTTKGHTAEAARLRLVLPLSRSVTGDEYARLWDWAAKRCGELGCPADRQARDACRFWFDPSTPAGGWRAQLLEGAPLDVEPVLAAMAPALRIVPRGPLPPAGTSEREKRARAYLAKLPGAVSNQGGHAQTWHAAMVVAVGFDLDEQAALRILEQDYNPRCDPPWSPRELEHKVADAITKCTAERGYLLRDRERVTSSHQAAARAPSIEANADWLDGMLYKADGISARRTYANAALIVRSHPDYAGKWALNEMTGAPWFAGEPIAETMAHEIRARIERDFGFTAPVADVLAGIQAAAAARPFHPVHEYLRSLDWDGIERLPSMARDFLGSSSKLHSEIVRRFMIGAVARALSPGCKLDTALMLTGPQGYRKSTFFSVLGGEWHADTFLDITTKDAALQLHGTWLYEFSELETVLTDRSESRLKAWMSSTHDLVRAPYARAPERRSRSAVIVGTTNHSRFLTDVTGSRRFWLVPVDRPIDTASLAKVRDQLWAEAVCLRDAGERWWLEEAEEAAREEANQEHRTEDSWEDTVDAYLMGKSSTTVGDVLSHAIKLEVGRHDKANQMRVARILRLLGWVRVLVREQGLVCREWQKAQPRNHLDQ